MGRAFYMVTGNSNALLRNCSSLNDNTHIAHHRHLNSLSFIRHCQRLVFQDDLLLLALANIEGCLDSILADSGTVIRIIERYRSLTIRHIGIGLSSQQHLLSFNFECQPFGWSIGSTIYHHTLDVSKFTAEGQRRIGSFRRHLNISGGKVVKDGIMSLYHSIRGLNRRRVINILTIRIIERHQRWTVFFILVNRSLHYYRVSSCLNTEPTGISMCFLICHLGLDAFHGILQPQPQNCLCLIVWNSRIRNIHTIKYSVVMLNNVEGMSDGGRINYRTIIGQIKSYLCGTILPGIKGCRFYCQRVASNDNITPGSST